MDDLATLLTLRLRGVASAEAVASATGGSREGALGRLVALDESGLVQLRTGRGAGWALTPAGWERLASLVAAELDGSGGRSAIAGAYQRFVPLNASFKDLCTRWQLRSREPLTPNDHDDPEYDRAVIGELESLHAQAVPLIGAVAAVLPRFGGYIERLSAALDRLVGGGFQWFTRPGIGSYHDVWMEMHADLLLTLGLERGAADA